MAPCSTHFLNLQTSALSVSLVSHHITISANADIYLNRRAPISRASVDGAAFFKETRNKRVAMAPALRNHCSNGHANHSEAARRHLCSAWTSTWHLMWADDASEITVALWVAAHGPTVQGMRRLAWRATVCHLGNLGCNQTLPFRQLFT